MTQPQPTPAARAKGPVGQPRNPVSVILLTIFTCGIYGLVWLYKTFEELKQHNDEGLGGLAGMLLCLVVVGDFLLMTEIQKTYEDDGRESPVNAVWGLLLWLIFPVGQYFAQVALNDYWISKGAAPLPS
jgi:hypothetical protein